MSREAVPGAPLIAVLANPNNPSPASAAATEEVETAARDLKQRILVLNVSSARDLEAAFAVMDKQGAGALLVMADPVLNILRNEIVALAARHTLPAIYEWREFAALGGLMSYGTDPSDAYRRIGVYAGKILGGEKPADS